VGVSELKAKTKTLGFGASESDVNRNTDDVLDNALRRHFRPEFLNRIDVICKFHPLTKEQIGQIAKILIKKFEKSLKERNISLNITQNAMSYIADKGYDVEFGARPLRRVIEQEIEDNVAEGIIAGAIKDNSAITVDYENGGIIIR
jgi:ATP-dependent Clp protease ATP-binding subunit ClpA